MLAGLTLLLLLAAGLGIRVLNTGRDVAAFLPTSGAELLSSSVSDQDTVTLCARFNTFQFTYEKYGATPRQVLLQMGPENTILASQAMTEERSAFKSYVQGKVMFSTTYT